MITIEEATRIIMRFDLGFTEGFVLRAIQNRKLESAPNPYRGSHYSKHGFGVSIDSFKQFLLSYGITEIKIKEVLPV
ncbi:hypothetical protein ACIQ2D_18200 [Lysinibacillus sp. NPDC097287]|uniref:hypothetical protein n=1 Tax=Lysinibacillus sp. NPDC097287 TaxID=3364144 RepID=UPI0038183696